MSIVRNLLSATVHVCTYGNNYLPSVSARVKGRGKYHSEENQYAT